MSDEDVSIWNHFEKVGIDKKAMCRICNNVYCYKTTISNLKHHLKQKHSDELDIHPDLLRNVVHKISQTPKRRQKRGRIWNFFQQCDDESQTAICIECSKPISFRSTITNLKSHLRSKHIDTYRVFESSTKEESIEDVDVAYEEVTYLENDTGAENEGGEGGEGVCRAELPPHAARMMRHLQAGHPRLLRTQISEEEADDSKNLSNDECDAYTEVIFLNETKQQKRKKSFNEKLPEPSIKKIKKEVRNVYESSSEDDTATNIEKQKSGATNCGEDITAFINYISTLLKDIPKDLFIKLQMEIINTIMATKLNYETPSIKTRCSVTDESAKQDEELTYDIQVQNGEAAIAPNSRNIVIMVPKLANIPNNVITCNSMTDSSDRIIRTAAPLARTPTQ